MIGRALVSRDRALRLNPAFVSFQFPSVLLIYRLVRFSTNSASDHSRLLTPASIAGRARKVWNGATLPSAPVSVKHRNPPDAVACLRCLEGRLWGKPRHSSRWHLMAGKRRFRPFAGPRSSVESGCGAVVLGRPCRLPPLSSGGALVGRP